jgi:MinD-like ATPase involved in chromosome partitioning or flagellar assembly
LQPHILVNQSDSPEQAREIIARVQQTARTFLHLTVSSAGHIPRDPAVAQAVVRRKPFAAENVRTPAGLAIEQLARRLVNLSLPKTERASFFAEVSHFIDRKAG